MLITLQLLHRDSSNANSKPGVSTSCVTLENPNSSGPSGSGSSASASVSSGEVNLNIKVWGQVNWTSDGNYSSISLPFTTPQPSHLPPPPQQNGKRYGPPLLPHPLPLIPHFFRRGYYVMVLFKVVSTTTSRKFICNSNLGESETWLYLLFRGWLVWASDPTISLFWRRPYIHPSCPRPSRPFHVRHFNCVVSRVEATTQK